MTAVIEKAYIQGVSTRSVDDLIQAMGMSGISKSQVSRLCEGFLPSASRRRRASPSHRVALSCELRPGGAAWREDSRRVSNGEQVYGVVGLAMRCPPSVDCCGYWQALALSALA